MDLATTRVLTTRTTGAGTTSTPLTLPTMAKAAHTATTTSSARTAVVLSLWIVLDLGVLTAVATTFQVILRTRDAELTRSRREHSPMDTLVHSPTIR